MLCKVKIHTIGRLKEHWLQEALQEYTKRLQGRIDIAWILSKDDPELIKRVEAENAFIALDSRGLALSSEALHKKLLQTGFQLTFVIGGALGLPQHILSRAAWIWSLSLLTFTHQMTRLILLEQLYRVSEIERNGPYHK